MNTPIAVILPRGEGFIGARAVNIPETSSTLGVQLLVVRNEPLPGKSRRSVVGAGLKATSPKQNARSASAHCSRYLKKTKQMRLGFEHLSEGS